MAQYICLNFFLIFVIITSIINIIDLQVFASAGPSCCTIVLIYLHVCVGPSCCKIVPLDLQVFSVGSILLYDWYLYLDFCLIALGFGLILI